MFDLNDVEPLRSGELIPDGAFAKVTMAIRPGGVDGDGDLDKGLLKPSTVPSSDVLSLDGEFTVVEGPYARRKFWQTFTVSGGKVDDKGASMGWNITKRIFRGMIDSALGLDPQDESDAARAKCQLRGLADLSGIIFVAKILVEPNKDTRYPDSNKLDRPVLPNEKEWRAIMSGEDVPPRPSKTRSAGGGHGPATTQAPAWAGAQQKPVGRDTGDNRHAAVATSGRSLRTGSPANNNVARAIGETGRPCLAERLSCFARNLGGVDDGNDRRHVAGARDL